MIGYSEEIIIVVCFKYDGLEVMGKDKLWAVGLPRDESVVFFADMACYFGLLVPTIVFISSTSRLYSVLFLGAWLF